jgi:c(7)-type cytochrome triheme protein
MLLFTLTMAAGWGALAQDVPDKIVFPSKMGNVTFNHTAHLKRAKNDCGTCHPKYFQQSKDPINYKAGMHKTAETAKTSCAGCHNAAATEIKAFESKGNCAKCHVKS